jgi:hypothetical protein
VKEPQARHFLESALRALAKDDARVGASPGVEARLLAEVQSIAAARRRRMVIAACAMAAAVLFALTASSWKFFSRTPSGGAHVAEVSTAFMPLDYGSVPATNVQIVRLAVPRAALASFGLTPLETVDRTSTDTVLADVLVGDDGLARAVRFVRPAAGQEQMP